MAGPASTEQVAQARRRRNEFIRVAQLQADKLLEEADAKARQVADCALTGAAAPQSDRERRADRAELAYLRTYSDVYRAHLRAYIEGVMDRVEEWEREVTVHRDAPP